MWFNAPHTQVNGQGSAPPGKIIMQPMASKSKVTARVQGNKGQKNLVVGWSFAQAHTKHNQKTGKKQKNKPEGSATTLPLVLRQGQPSKACPRAIHSCHGGHTGTGPGAATGSQCRQVHHPQGGVRQDVEGALRGGEEDVHQCQGGGPRVHSESPKGSGCGGGPGGAHHPHPPHRQVGR